MPARKMSAEVARRTAIAAQALASPRDAPAEPPPTRRTMRSLVHRLGLLQLDSVNVALRAHYAPLFARLGPYDADALDALAWSDSARRPRVLVEYWAHEASLLPVADWPLLRWRMRDNAGRVGRRLGPALERRPDLLEAVHGAVATHGPLEAGQAEEAVGAPGPTRAAGGWWNRTDTKVACEHLFATGVLSTATRRGFRRVYDLTERVLPATVLGRDPAREDAIRELTRRAAAALGVATEPDLRDYYRLPPAESRAAVAELVDAGELEPVTVDGWEAPAYRAPGARTPRRVAGRALLAPFDPLIWSRPRTQRLFDFRYRIEIYTPAHRRRHGYYVFPFLLEGHLVARVDLKADRGAAVLQVPGAFAEDRAAENRAAGGAAAEGRFSARGVGRAPDRVPDRSRVAAELAGELGTLARWLGLDGVRVADHGDLAPTLARAVARGGADQ